MPTEKIVTLYTFDELSDKAKKKAREWFRTDYPDYNWWESNYEDFERIAAFMGIKINASRHDSTKELDIQFTGFWSQGDGASFTGVYEYSGNAVLAIKEYAPLDEALHTIAAEFDRLQGLYAGTIRASITRSNAMRYVHQYMMDVEEISVFPDDDKESYISPEDEKALRDNCRALAGWLYDSLEKEHDYLCADEQVDDSIRANEYTFLETGERED